MFIFFKNGKKTHKMAAFGVHWQEAGITEQTDTENLMITMFPEAGCKHGVERPGVWCGEKKGGGETVSVRREANVKRVSGDIKVTIKGVVMIVAGIVTVYAAEISYVPPFKSIHNGSGAIADDGLGGDFRREYPGI